MGLMELDTIDVLRLSYLSAALAVLLVFFTPPLRDRFLSYGARSSTTPVQSKKQDEKQSNKPSSNILSKLLDELATSTVPHDYFWTFYFLSTSLSPFWAGEALYLHGPLFGAIADRTNDQGTSMSFEQVKITWLLMFLQGGRRLYESLLSMGAEFKDETKKASEMWVGHWVLGLAFYLGMSVAVWVEGIPAIRNHSLCYRDLSISAPTLRSIFAILIFILASGFQHDCHTYLAYLKNSTNASSSSAETAEVGNKNVSETSKTDSEYKLPDHPAFASLICPHYTAECLIYLSLTVIAAPKGEWINLTLATALVFVAVNLGVTAYGTQKWYEQKFGSEAVKGKWRMIPFVW